MNKRKISLYIEDILESINKIESYISDLDKREIEHNTMIIDAVIRNFEIIGEATKYITQDIRKKYPDIPWGDMIALRNIVIHNYLGIDFDNIYKIAKEDFPATKNKLKKCLSFLIKLEES